MPSSGFDRLAPAYDGLAALVFGDAIKKAQSWLLDYIPTGSSVLIVGGGTGWILQEISNKRIQCSSIHFLDISSEMIRLAKKRKGVAPSVVFQQGEVWDLDESLLFDVIICPFFLDLFEGKELSKIIEKLNSHLRPSGWLLYADFQQSTGAKRLWSSLLISVMYSFFRLFANISAKKLEDPSLSLSKLGYRSVLRKRKNNSMIRAEVFIKKSPE